jgi:secondary thiamine-phosphate synthase enzyme
LRESKIENGIVTIFAQHTSCSLIVMENADPTARRDLEEFFDRLVPENSDYFEHDSEGADDMPSHIRMVLTHSSETIPVAEGRMQLGTWQGNFPFRTSARRAPAEDCCDGDGRIMEGHASACPRFSWDVRKHVPPRTSHAPTATISR